MATITLRGVPVSFPFQPYDIQKDYMEKVIEALQNGSNAVLESPTGTGKTLSLLCSSLAWLLQKKAECQAGDKIDLNIFAHSEELRFNPKGNPKVNKFIWDVPKIIYSSRTHSQLSQAMQELKSTTYKHVRASIIGSREQMCIHPQVSQEQNSTNKIHMCRALVNSKSCYLQNRVEKMSLSQEIQSSTVVDIEDLIQMGNKQKFCPYYMSRDLQKNADIIFLPYNYLLDPKARRAQKLDLRNSVIILDEAHNVEHICEDSASFQIKSTDVTLCIEEVTDVMKTMDDNSSFTNVEDLDFSPEDLMLLKTMLLNLEKAIDEIPIKNKQEGETYEGKYIFEIFAKAGIDDQSQALVIGLLDKLIQFLSTRRENPFQRTGNGVQMLQDLLLIVFQGNSEEFKSKINQCFKVHIIVEEKEVKKKQMDSWLSKASDLSTKRGCRVLSYWCFNPGFGMNMMLALGVHSVILTSGTLAPLKPLISELGIDVGVRLENPHVVTNQQVCVKIIGTGPDGEQLNSSYQNRNNPNYIMSLGMAITNIARMVPHGMLVFFPSYPVMSKCQEEWQTSQIWSSLNEMKHVFVEPKGKDAFNTCIKEFYNRVNNPAYKGAIFMAVCRGKVSEGLDFADRNGRAVLITGLPYPPLRDPRIVLKKSYLDRLHATDKEYLTGQDWYSLEASRAVNQAIGRVIRHAKDYGAILLLDTRFNSPKIRSQMSLWLRNRIAVANKFGDVIRDLKTFFKGAEEQFPLGVKTLTSEPQKENYSYLQNNSSDNTDSCASTSGLVTIHPKSLDEVERKAKKRKFNVLQVDYSKANKGPTKEDMRQFIRDIRETLDKSDFIKFSSAIATYRNDKNFDKLVDDLDQVLMNNQRLKLMLEGLLPYIKEEHRERFQKYCDKLRRI